MMTNLADKQFFLKWDEILIYNICFTIIDDKILYNN